MDLKVHLWITVREQTLIIVLNRAPQTLPQPLHPETTGHSSCLTLLWSHSAFPLLFALDNFTVVHTSGSDTREEVSREPDELVTVFPLSDSSILLVLQPWEQTFLIQTFTKLILCGPLYGRLLITGLVMLNHRSLWLLCLRQWIYLNSTSWDPVCANTPYKTIVLSSFSLVLP